MEARIPAELAADQGFPPSIKAGYYGSRQETILKKQQNSVKQLSFNLKIN